MPPALPSISKIAEILSRDVAGAEALVPGTGHSAEDRSLAIKLDNAAPDGFVVHSVANDDPIACRDHVRQKLGLSEFAPSDLSDALVADPTTPWATYDKDKPISERQIAGLLKPYGIKPKTFRLDAGNGLHAGVLRNVSRRTSAGNRGDS